MTKEQKTALEYLRDFTNPSNTEPTKNKDVFQGHAAQVALKLDSAKERVQHQMEATTSSGIVAAMQIMSSDKIIGSEAGYLLAAGAWHDLPLFLTGKGQHSKSVKLRQFRRLRTADSRGVASIEWDSVIELVGPPAPPLTRKP